MAGDAADMPEGMTRAQWRQFVAAAAAAATMDSSPEVIVEDVTAATRPANAADAGANAQDAGAAAHETIFTAAIPVAKVRRGRRSTGRIVLTRVAAAAFPAGVMTVVGLLLVGTTMPMVSTASPVAPTAAVETPEIQAFISGSSTVEQGERASGYEVETMEQVAASSGIQQYSGAWINDPTSEVQWPFPVGVPISAGFSSAAYLSQFGRVHGGVDFTPGAGAEIHAVASGTVRIATESGGDYGVTVVIDHEIDGQKVSTRYGHMQYGSLRVSPGDTVEVGDVLGTVGSTGNSTGAHLHLEVLLDGVTKIDPLPWLQEHAGG